MDTPTQSCPGCGVTLHGRVSKCYHCGKTLVAPPSAYVRVSALVATTVLSKVFVTASALLAFVGLLVFVACRVADITWLAIAGAVLSAPFATVLCVCMYGFIMFTFAGPILLWLEDMRYGPSCANCGARNSAETREDGHLHCKSCGHYWARRQIRAIARI